jgi:hypothetical protein
MNDTPTTQVGILPVGALGAAFMYHLTRGCTHNIDLVQFVQRRGSANQAALMSHGFMQIASGDIVSSLEVKRICRPDLVTCGKQGWIPDMVLVVTQPDQLLPVLSDMVNLLELLYESNGLETALRLLPTMILSSNGIYHERVRRYLVELLEESMLYGRLPDLWSDGMGVVVGKLLRGVTVQTGYRDGSGPTAINYAGPSARTTVAGGNSANRKRCVDALTWMGGWFEDAGDSSPIRVEFDKALINLWSNLLGQLKAIDDSGNFRILKVKEIYHDPNGNELRELSGHLFAIGRAVRAYSREDNFDELHNKALSIALSSAEHYPSSLKWIEAQIHSGTLSPQLTPTEKWLIDPLTHYAKTAGLDDAAIYFASLRDRIEQKLASVIRRRN